ncbi:MAG: hypothetical protein QFB86_02305, partial [Patescibacteria group bacterium]|nr:hypothetical protein [Patescibacteria group bacterium]
YAQLIGSSGSGNSDAAGAYQLFLALIMSLAIIWSLRQLLAGNEIRVRDAFYKGMYPLIPYLLVLIVVGLQLIPLVIGSTVYSAVITNGIAVHLIEKVLWAVFFIACASLTLYWLASSLMALYIATLPEMTPLLALRSARDLVRNRRLAVLRKMTFLPLLFLVTSALIMVPIIIVAAPIAQVVFFILSMLSLIVIHAYLYLLYRDLLNE